MIVGFSDPLCRCLGRKHLDFSATFKAVKKKKKKEKKTTDEERTEKTN